ncbi:MAG: hypothetical protein ACHQT8_07590, partial [Chlamydiales bacterium]
MCTSIAPRAVVRRRRIDIPYPPVLAKQPSGSHSLRSTLQVSSGKEWSMVQLPGLLFARIFFFLHEKEQNTLSLISHQTNACRWNAYILTKMPKVYSFYRKIVEKEQPCRKHWEALCKAEVNINEAHLKIKEMKLDVNIDCAFRLSNCWFKIGSISEPLAPILIREAFPQHSTITGKTLNLAEDLNGGPFALTQAEDSLKSHIFQSITYKLDSGYCVNGMLGERVFWTVGEAHGVQEDMDFFKLTLRASEKTIALFYENSIASEESDSQAKEFYKIPGRSIFKGLDSPDRNSRILQFFADLLCLKHCSTLPISTSKLFNMLLIDLFSSSKNVRALYD